MKSAKTILVIISTLFLVISSSCGPFWELAKDPDIQGPSWDVSVELPVVGKTEKTRIVPIELLFKELKRFEGPVSLVQDQIEKVGPIEIELPTETEDLIGKWIIRAEIFVELEYLMPFGATVTISFSKDRDSVFSEPSYRSSVHLPLRDVEGTVVSTVFSLDFDFTEELLVETLSGEMFVGASVILIVPEGETRIYIDTNHYIWPKIWAVADVRVNPPDEQR